MPNDYIPYGRQEISDKDIDAVKKVLKSDFLTQGPEVPIFENSIKNYTQAQHAIAFNSATSALHIACLALGVGEGDTIWTSPNTFVASANCGIYCGSKVDFVDINYDTLNMCHLKLKEKLEIAKDNNSLPKVVIPVHFGGLSCNMMEIHNLAKEYGFSIIEDASHAIGGEYLYKKIGSCQYSDITIMSFHPVKIITTGEGGIALTNSKLLAEEMSTLRTHGVIRDPKKFINKEHGPWYYEQIALGFNYRMTDILAALGTSQLERLDEFIEKRNLVSQIYDDEFELLPLRPQARVKGIKSSFHLYVVKLDLDYLKFSQREIFQILRDKGIGVNIHYIPVHLQPFYRNLGFCEGDFPVSEKYYKEAISLPIFPSISEQEINKVVQSVKSVI